MFNLENAIQTWKRKFRRNPAFEDGDVAELESHLREEVEKLKAEGLSEEEAFNGAIEEIGESEPIGDELYKSRATQKAGPVPPWKQSSWMPSMLPNYVKVAIRNFRNNMAFSLINILGLSVALSISLLVIAFTKDQADYDDFHTKADRIYRVNTSLSTSGSSSVRRYASSPFSLGPILENSFPEVVESVRLKPFTSAASFGENRLRLSGFQVDSSFFSLFDFKIKSGNPDKALTRPNSIVLTEATAVRFFGNADPVGKAVTLQNNRQYVVTALLSNLHDRSHLEFEALISLSSMGGMGRQDWEDPTWYTYILTDENAVPESLETKLFEIVRSYHPDYDGTGYRLDLQQLNKINLGPLLARQIGRITPIEFVYFLSALALVIMLAAVMNYVNLSVARSLKRVKEIGLRKVVGASRLQLMVQFLSESVVVACISLVIGMLIFGGWLLPIWNSLQLATADFGKIAINFSRDLDLYLFFIGFSLLVGLLAGIYPAFKLSSFSPLNSFKEGPIKEGISGWSFRKIMVVFQIALSVILVISTLLLYRQSNLLLNTDFGFEKSDVINIELGEFSYDSFKNEISSQTGIAGVSAISSLPGADFPTKTWAGTDQRQDSIEVAIYSADQNMLEKFGLTPVAGRIFSTEYSTDSQRAVVLNEMAVEQLGFTTANEALGQFINLSGVDGSLQIVGVVEDFQFDFLWKPISPLVIRNNPSNFNIASIHLESQDRENIIKNLEATWKKFEPVAPFDYKFYSEQVANVYRDFKELAGVVAVLSVIAILIACLGLLAMAHYDTNARVKEIGIRKVLGANVKNLVLMLSSDFSKMTAVALLFGIPVAVYLNKLWLQIFVYKAALDFWIVCLGVVLVSLLALFSIGWQTVKAATANPVKNLRSE